MLGLSELGKVWLIFACLAGYLITGTLYGVVAGAAVIYGLLIAVDVIEYIVNQYRKH